MPDRSCRESTSAGNELERERERQVNVLEEAKRPMGCRSTRVHYPNTLARIRGYVQHLDELLELSVTDFGNEKVIPIRR